MPKSGSGARSAATVACRTDVAGRADFNLLKHPPIRKHQRRMQSVCAGAGLRGQGSREPPHSVARNFPDNSGHRFQMMPILVPHGPPAAPKNLGASRIASRLKYCRASSPPVRTFAFGYAPGLLPARRIPAADTAKPFPPSCWTIRRPSSLAPFAMISAIAASPGSAVTVLPPWRIRDGDLRQTGSPELLISKNPFRARHGPREIFPRNS